MASLRVVLAFFIFSQAHAVGPIEAIEIQAVQKEWAEGIVKIANSHKDGKSRDYVKALTDQFVDSMYAYGVAPTLLKPAIIQATTSASFCTTRDAAIAHFIGEDALDTFDDKGFALQPWTAVRFENVGTLLQDDIAMAMGNCFMTRSNGEESRLEYSMGYVRDSVGKLRISLHHASTPASAEGAQSTATQPVVSTAETTTTTTTIMEATPVSQEVGQATAMPADDAKEPVIAAPTAEEQSATTTTTTTTTAMVKSTTDWFFDGHRASSHHGHNHNGFGMNHHRKPLAEVSKGSFLGAAVKVLILISFAASIITTFFVSQGPPNSKMSTQDKFAAAMGMFQRKIERLIGTKEGDAGFLPTSYDKFV